MKRFLVMVLALVICVTAAEARRKKDVAGAIQDGVYQDNRFGFKMTVRANWQPRVKKDEENHRLILTQKNAEAPPHFQSAPDYTYIPRLVIWADTSSLSPAAMLDSLQSPSFKSKQKKDIMSEFEFLQQSEIIPKDRKLPTIAGKTGLVWEGETKYRKEVQASQASSAGVLVYGGYSGYIVGVRSDKGVLVMMQLMCERDFHERIYAEAVEMINTLEWVEAPPDGE